MTRSGETMCILFLSLIFLICLFLVLRTIHPLYAAKNGKFQEDVHSPDAELQWVGLIVSRSNRFRWLERLCHQRATALLWRPLNAQ